MGDLGDGALDATDGAVLLHGALHAADGAVFLDRALDAANGAVLHFESGWLVGLGWGVGKSVGELGMSDRCCCG